MGRDPDPEVSHILEVTGLCQALFCLPRQGGLFDQDPYLVYGMEAVLRAQQQKMERKTAEEKRKLDAPRRA